MTCCANICRLDYLLFFIYYIEPIASFGMPNWRNGSPAFRRLVLCVFSSVTERYDTVFFVRSYELIGHCRIGL
jgi:hypothetical protein